MGLSLEKAGLSDLGTALQNAASIAGLMITTEAMVAELPKEEDKMPGRHAHGGMGDMDMM